MNSTLDLNLPYIANENEFLFDLNQTPINVESSNTENDDVAIVNNPIYSNDSLPETDPDDAVAIVNNPIYSNESLLEMDPDDDDAIANNPIYSNESLPEIDPEMDGVDLMHGTCRNISNAERLAIYNALLERSQDGKLKKFTTREVSELFLVPIRTVQRIWKQAKDTSNGEEVNVSHKKTGRCGRKRVSLDLNQVMDIPFQKRTTLRSLSMGLGIAPSTLHKRVKERTYKSTRIPIK